MNLRFKALLVWTGCAILGMSALESHAQYQFSYTNSRVALKANSKTTNGTPKTNLIVTTIAVNPTPAATNEIKEAEPPKETFTNSVDMVLVQVGSYWVGKYDVTQKEYREVMHSNPSAFGGDKRPVDSVSYDDALEFCRKLTDMDIKEKKLPKGYYYTLPTEDEWQGFMADAPLTTAVTSLDASRSGTSPVGSLGPNSLGLYDTRGNVWEFVMSDESKPYRVLKGGSWEDFVDINLRPQFRWYSKAGETKNTFGFRCVL